MREVEDEDEMNHETRFTIAERVRRDLETLERET